MLRRLRFAAVKHAARALDAGSAPTDPSSCVCRVFLPAGQSMAITVVLEVAA
ncbi:hypothetical protein SAMN04515669_2264 [Jiangella sp. DSM 45060]|nr:hypothetical protein SAMN04515669_2264 [Jiangella sp. DSM 45060]